jgi:hypothetical protein
LGAAGSLAGAARPPWILPLKQQRNLGSCTEFSVASVLPMYIVSDTFTFAGAADLAYIARCLYNPGGVSSHDSAALINNRYQESHFCRIVIYLIIT